MSVTFRNYTKQFGITKDYEHVRKFFLSLGHAEFECTRWDWMITHSYLDQSALDKIGLWEDQGEVVAIATYDTTLGHAYCLTLPKYAYLKQEMLVYAKTHLAHGDYFRIVIHDLDTEFQMIATSLGFVATPSREAEAILDTNKADLSYDLPEGFQIISLKDRLDLYEYRRVLWKGFNHEKDGEGPLVFNDDTLKSATIEMIRPYVDLNLKIAVVAPDGHFVSYSGIWYNQELGYAVVEPVATDPDYRKMGLGKAAVLEGVKRVKALGAIKVYVGSEQQFYYNIGFAPYATSSIWMEKPKA